LYWHHRCWWRRAIPPMHDTCQPQCFWVKQSRLLWNNIKICASWTLSNTRKIRRNNRTRINAWKRHCHKAYFWIIYFQSVIC
jgi:hypothetical protein